MVVLACQETTDLLNLCKEVRFEYNLGATTDNFNEEYLKFLIDWVLKKNVNKLPFAFPSVFTRMELISSLKVSNINFVLLC